MDQAKPQTVTLSDNNHSDMELIPHILFEP